MEISQKICVPFCVHPTHLCIGVCGSWVWLVSRSWLDTCRSRSSRCQRCVSPTAYVCYISRRHSDKTFLSTVRNSKFPTFNFFVLKVFVPLISYSRFIHQFVFLHFLHAFEKKLSHKFANFRRRFYPSQPTRTHPLLTDIDTSGSGILNSINEDTMNVQGALADKAAVFVQVSFTQNCPIGRQILTNFD